MNYDQFKLSNPYDEDLTESEQIAENYQRALEQCFDYLGNNLDEGLTDEKKENLIIEQADYYGVKHDDIINELEKNTL